MFDLKLLQIYYYPWQNSVIKIQMKLQWQLSTIPSIPYTHNGYTPQYVPPPVYSWALYRYSWWQNWCLWSGYIADNIDSRIPASSTWQSNYHLQSSPGNMINVWIVHFTFRLFYTFIQNSYNSLDIAFLL